MTRRDNRFWSGQDTYISNYSNNRRTDPGFQYDADGNLTQDTDLSYSYDAAGENVSLTKPFGAMAYSTAFDGDGQMVKRAQTQSGSTTMLTYYLRSTVLGGRVITELGGQGSSLGQKQKGYVFAGSQVLAEQENNIVKWQHQNPISGSQGYSIAQGVYFQKAEFDAMGVDVGFQDPLQNLGGDVPPEEGTPGLLAGSGIPNGRCTLDGIAIDCAWAMELLQTESAALAPAQNVKSVVYQGKQTWAYFNAYADGYSGYVPNGAGYTGSGNFSSLNGGPPSLRTNTIHDTNFAVLNGASGEAQLGQSNEFTGLAEPKNSGTTATSAQQRPIWCQPDVIKAMNEAWSRSGNAGMAGGPPIEAGFNLDGTPNNYQVSSSFTNEVGKMSIKYSNLYSAMPTFANFHVHPRGADSNNGFPSTPNNNYEGNKKGDTGAFDEIYTNKNGKLNPTGTHQAIQVYVMSWYGLSMYDPATGKSQQLAKGTGFLRGEGCPH